MLICLRCHIVCRSPRWINSSWRSNIVCSIQCVYSAHICGVGFEEASSMFAVAHMMESLLFLVICKYLVMAALVCFRYQFNALRHINTCVCRIFISKVVL